MAILRDPEIKSRGFVLRGIELPDEVRASVERRDWPALDALIRRETLPGGRIFDALLEHGELSSIEFIISIRSSDPEPDEDGIWHDDGSRAFAFSLSLTPDPGAIEGGRLEVRRRGEEGPCPSIPTPPYGTMIVFATGESGFEHRINRVARGERIIIAGWCS